ncbi:MAG: hypothetical protein GY864_07575 [Desulfobacterales bacterium]|nr:hypothetical protein [Desulfobacterales bacterium]
MRNSRQLLEVATAVFRGARVLRSPFLERPATGLNSATGRLPWAGASLRTSKGFRAVADEGGSPLHPTSKFLA